MAPTSILVGWFYLDYVGPEVSEQLPYERPGNVCCELDDGDPSQWLSARLHASLLSNKTITVGVQVLARGEFCSALALRLCFREYSQRPKGTL